MPRSSGCSRPVGFALTREGGAGGLDAVWTVDVPAWRHDVTQEVDLIEEVARLVGFDALPDDLRPFRPGTVPDHPLVSATRASARALVADGCWRRARCPFVRGDDATHPRVANPLAADEPHLRDSALDTLARRAEHNLAHMQGDVRLFEIGSVFAASARQGALPEERLVAAALVMGLRRPPHFTEPRPPAFDAWDAKASASGWPRGVPGSGECARPVEAATAVRRHGGPRALDRQRRRPPRGRCARGRARRAGVGVAGVRRRGHVRRDRVRAGGRARRERLAGGGGTRRPASATRRTCATAPSRPRPPPSSTSRSSSPTPVAAARVEEVLRRSGGDTLERVALLDEFRGGDVPAGRAQPALAADAPRPGPHAPPEGGRRPPARSWCRRSSASSACAYARADVAGTVSRTPSASPSNAVFDDLERAFRHLGEELAFFRRRALDAERRLRELTGQHAGDAAAGGRRPGPVAAELRDRVAALEVENGDLRDRLAEAAERTRALADRVRFRPAAAARRGRRVSADATGAPAAGAGAPTWTSVRVQIVGDEYTLRSEAPEAHTRAVAEHVDRVIRQVLGTGTVVETHKAAILAALRSPTSCSAPAPTPMPSPSAPRRWPPTCAGGCRRRNGGRGRLTARACDVGGRARHARVAFPAAGQ
jgi:hypothetical protein